MNSHCLKELRLTCDLISYAFLCFVTVARSDDGFISHIKILIGVLGLDSGRGLGIFLFTTASRTVLGPTQPLIQWVPGALSLGVKRQGREADHSLPSSAEVKECVELYLHSPSMSSWRGAELKKSTGTTLLLPVD
jgi:hypothetical protein